VVTARRRLGDFGERVAGQRLENTGMTVLARNVRTPRGEIDLVAADGDDVVFVEVRTRRGAPGLAAESVVGPKLRRMWQCAMDYCEGNGVAPERARIDVVAVELAANGTVGAVEHFRGVEIPGE
jgi:putative endonuclease